MPQYGNNIWYESKICFVKIFLNFILESNTKFVHPFRKYVFHLTLNIFT